MIEPTDMVGHLRGSVTTPGQLPASTHRTRVQPSVHTRERGASPGGCRRRRDQAGGDEVKNVVLMCATRVLR